MLTTALPIEVSCDIDDLKERRDLVVYTFLKLAQESSCSAWLTHPSAYVRPYPRRSDNMRDQPAFRPNSGTVCLAVFVGKSENGSASMLRPKRTALTFTHLDKAR